MKDYGSRLQYSVFLCDLGMELANWRAAIHSEVDLRADSVVQIDLGEDRCVSQGRYDRGTANPPARAGRSVMRALTAVAKYWGALAPWSGYVEN